MSRFLVAVVLVLAPVGVASAQESAAPPVTRDAPAPQAPAAEPATKGGEWYVQWGYNTGRYAGTDIRFQQPGAGNDFTLHGVVMDDDKAWDIWNHSVTVPQYSIRVGKFFRPNTAIEFNFDHAKAILVPDQVVRASGVVGGVPVDDSVRAGDIADPYKLNNGANFFLVNAVQRFSLLGELGTPGNISFLAKAGVGFTMPHTENTVLGEPNEEGFQFGGLGLGLEGALRVHIYKILFAEIAQKAYYARYRGLNIADGDADQSLWAYVTILSFGVTW
jgi:hypothetical protein